MRQTSQGDRSGNKLGIQRDASAAGKAGRSSARLLSETNTPCLIMPETTRRAWRSTVPNDTSGVAARQLASIEHGLKDCARFRWQEVEANLFFRPKQDARAQRVGLHEPFHD